MQWQTDTTNSVIFMLYKNGLWRLQNMKKWCDQLEFTIFSQCNYRNSLNDNLVLLKKDMEQFIIDKEWYFNQQDQTEPYSVYSELGPTNYE